MYSIGEAAKIIHVSCAALSFCGFFARGVWMLKDSAMLQRRWVRIAPHVVDSLLLASAVALAVAWHMSPLEQHWLMAKIIALVLYIGLGMVALRFGRTKRLRLGAWVLGLVTFVYIVSVAVTKSTLGFFVLF
jgi:uncharacterized membrane protein SirB2